MKDALRTFAIHRLTVGWFLLFTINALCTSIMAALAGTEWGAADGQTRFLIAVAVLASWTNTMAAFFSNAANRLKDGKSLLPDSTSSAPFNAPKQ